MNILSNLLDLLFPPKCPFCGRVLDAPGICGKCQNSLPWTEEGKILQTLPGNLRCAAPLWYEDAVREGLLAFKFQGSQAAARSLGELVARCAAEQFSGEFDTVTWVPVSRKRLRKRGYDQARLLAEQACRLWDTKPVQLLEKCVDTPAQSGISEPAARRANVLGVFDPVPGAEIAGKRILLVDDICTTGATLAECARVLRDAGAAEVVCVAIAHAR
jgi:ComF family protein